MTGIKTGRRRWDVGGVSIIGQAVVAALLCCGVLLCFFISYIIKTTDLFQDANVGFAQDLAIQQREGMYDNYRGLDDILHYAIYQPEVQQFLRAEQPQERYDSYQNMTAFLEGVTQLNGGIQDFVLVDGAGEVYALAGLQIPLHPPQGEETAFYAWTDQAGQVQFVLAAPICSIGLSADFGQPIGTLYMVVEPGALVGQDSTHLSRSRTFLRFLTEDGVCFWENSSAALPFSARQSQPLMEETVEELGIRIQVFPGEDYGIVPLYNTHMSYTLAMVFLLVLMVVFWTFFLSYAITPLKKLADVVQRITGGTLEDLDTQVELDGYLEIRAISRRFNTMLSTIRALTGQVVETNSRLYEAQLAKEKTELEYLRSQINPHFLYNTLESLTGLAVTTGDRRVIQFSKSLSSMFKYCLKADAQVRLAHELKIVKSYIYIQNIRFSDRFTAEFYIDEALLDCFVPKMILQPLVENAIIHGIENSAERCVLCIAVRRQGGMLELEVYNTGTPMDPHRLAEIRQLLEHGPEPGRGEKPKGIGLYNVHNRIRLAYGAPYGVQVDSCASGTAVTVRLALTGETPEDGMEGSG